MEKNVYKALNDLQKSLKTIKSLAEWTKLKRIENRTINPFNQMYDDTPQELAKEVWYFVLLMTDLNESAQDDKTLREKLSQINREFRQLDCR